jgi:hypothetical protein
MLFVGDDWAEDHVRHEASEVERRLVESAWGAVSGLLLIRFPRPLAEPVMWNST